MKQPLHKKAEYYIRELIGQEAYQNGKLLPPETELAEQLNMSRNTLRQAINTLVIEGLLIRKKGYGTRVQKRGIVSGVQNWLSFSQEMSMLGVEIKNYELQVSFKKLGQVTAHFFQYDKDDDIETLVMERVRGSLSYPFVYFISYFNPRMGLDLDINFNAPLYDILEEQYGVVVKRSEEEITARCADEEIAQKLRIQPNEPILVRRRFVYDTENVPVEFNIGYYRADSFTYSVIAER